MIRRAKKNKYKAKGKKAFTLRFGLKCFMTLTLFSILSLTAIFAHDFITQTPFFNITRIDISGIKHATRDEILKLTTLKESKNIFELNTGLAEKEIISHPWIQSAEVKRQLPSELLISIIEHKALAIVHVGNTAALINFQGLPFKQYIPDSDKLSDITVVKGLKLNQIDDKHLFTGRLFESVMEFLNTNKSGHVQQITANEYMGISILSEEFHRLSNDPESDIIPIKLGFNNYKAKLKKAKRIYKYMAEHFTDRSIHTMDLFDIEKAFIRTIKHSK